MYVVEYYIVFVMRNESTMINCQKIRYCIIVLQIQGMIQLSIWFDRHVVRLTYIDINMDIVYL